MGRSVIPLLTTLKVKDYRPLVLLLLIPVPDISHISQQYVLLYGGIFMATGQKAILDHRVGAKWGEVQGEYTRIRVLEPLITRDVRAIVSSLGNSLDGLQFAAKTGTSVTNKLEREQSMAAKRRQPFVPAQSLQNMRDLIRYTEICRHDDIVQAAKSTIQAMKACGYTLSGLKNYYKTPFPDTGYMGIHLNFLAPYGQEIELQVHSPESFAAKQEGHRLYERIRAISTPTAEKVRLQQEIKKIHGSIHKCKDCDTLDDYLLPKKDRVFLLAEKRSTTDIELQSAESQSGETLKYSISRNDKLLMDGFEHTFRDGSAWSYRHFAEEQAAQLTALTKDGEEIAEKYIQHKDLDLRHIVEYAEKQDTDHSKWMEEHMPGQTDTITDGQTLAKQILLERER